LVEGGNISYDILPEHRKYGYKSLALALIQCQGMQLKRVLITCNEDNIPSQKIIFQNGGKLEIHFSENGKNCSQILD
jgi:predicted acetyltransferase